jgi:hypothetical protein
MYWKLGTYAVQGNVEVKTVCEKNRGTMKTGRLCFALRACSVFTDSWPGTMASSYFLDRLII